MGIAFEISCEAAIDGEPSEGAFDDPAFGENLEARCPIGPLDDLDGSRGRFADLGVGLSAIADNHFDKQGKRAVRCSNSRGAPS